MSLSQGELVLAKAVEFFVVMITGIGTREDHPLVGLDGEIIFGGEFEVNDFLPIRFKQEKVKFAQGVVLITADGKVGFENLITRAGVQ